MLLAPPATAYLAHACGRFKLHRFPTALSSALLMLGALAAGFTSTSSLTDYRRKHLVVAPWAAFLPGSNWPPAEDMGPLAAWLLCACHAAVCASLLLLALHVGMLPLYTALGPRRHYRHKLQDALAVFGHSVLSLEHMAGLATLVLLLAGPHALAGAGPLLLLLPGAHLTLRLFDARPATHSRLSLAADLATHAPLAAVYVWRAVALRQPWELLGTAAAVLTLLGLAPAALVMFGRGRDLLAPERRSLRPSLSFEDAFALSSEQHGATDEGLYVVFEGEEHEEAQAPLRPSAEQQEEEEEEEQTSVTTSSLHHRTPEQRAPPTAQRWSARAAAAAVELAKKASSHGGTTNIEPAGEGGGAAPEGAAAPEQAAVGGGVPGPTEGAQGASPFTPAQAPSVDTIGARVAARHHQPPPPPSTTAPPAGAAASAGLRQRRGAGRRAAAGGVTVSDLGSGGGGGEEGGDAGGSFAGAQQQQQQGGEEPSSKLPAPTPRRPQGKVVVQEPLSGAGEDVEGYAEEEEGDLEEEEDQDLEDEEEEEELAEARLQQLYSRARAAERRRLLRRSYALGVVLHALAFVCVGGLLALTAAPPRAQVAAALARAGGAAGEAVAAQALRLRERAAGAVGAGAGQAGHAMSEAVARAEELGQQAAGAVGRGAGKVAEVVAEVAAGAQYVAREVADKARAVRREAGQHAAHEGGGLGVVEEVAGQRTEAVLEAAKRWLQEHAQRAAAAAATTGGGEGGRDGAGGMADGEAVTPQHATGEGRRRLDVTAPVPGGATVA